MNANPTIFEIDNSPEAVTRAKNWNYDDASVDEFTSDEIYDLIRVINDPEHPLSLEQLKVVRREHVYINDKNILIKFTPTIPHCSMATLIGLCIRVKLINCLPSRFKVDIKIAEGTHNSELSVNKQLNDKERVAAALENAHLRNVVYQCIS